MKQQLHDRIDIDFDYHPPKPDDGPDDADSQLQRYGRIRERARLYAHELVDDCPESRELSLALTSLQEAVFWANAAIARNE